MVLRPEGTGDLVEAPGFQLQAHHATRDGRDEGRRRGGLGKRIFRLAAFLRCVHFVIA